MLGVVLFRRTPKGLELTGEADFVLVVLAADMEAYEAFTRRHLLADANVRSFVTHVSMERVKTGLALPLSTR